MYRDLLKYHWGIEADRIEPMAQATASCFRVFAKEEFYFLKEFQRTFSVSRAMLDAEICTICNANNIPASEILYTVSGEAVAVFQNRIYQLQKYVFGETPQMNSLEEDLIYQAAAHLGKIHRVLKNKDLPHLFDLAWFEKFDEAKYIAFYHETLAVLKEKAIEDSLKKKIESDVLFRISFTKKMNELACAFEGITYASSHADYTPSQLICDGERIVRIIDFANVHTVPVSWELLRFYYLASSDCKTPQNFDVKRFRNYLSSYTAYCPLTEKDLKNMPYVFLYYMGRNRFLYRRFLETGDAAALNESVRQAAFSKYFYENAEDFFAKIKI